MHRTATGGSADEPFGVRRELSGAGESAEEVGGLFEDESAGCMLGVYRHLADGVDWKLAVHGLALRDGCE